MIKRTYSRLPIIIAFVALMLASPSAYLNAGSLDVSQFDKNGSNQSEAPGLMAQATETSRSVTTSTSSTTEAPLAEEYRSVESSSSSTRSVVEAPPVEEHRSVERSTSSTRSVTEAAAPKKPHCADQCRDQYDSSMTECNQPDHPHHKKCEKWAREREKDCLKRCYRK